MKKIEMKIAIGMLFCVISLQGGPVLNMLQEKKGELESRKKQLVDNRNNLSIKVYMQLKGQLIDQIDTVIKKQLDVFLVSIDNSKNSIKNISAAGLTFAGIGDISRTLDSVKDVLDSTKGVLAGVKQRFEPIIHDLSEKDDPLGIYKGFDKAIDGLDASLVAMNRLEDFVRALDL